MQLINFRRKASLKNILVIGSLNTDLTIHTPIMPRLGETLVGSGFAAAAGGKGANQAAAAAKLGGKVRMLGAVGCDDNGRMLLSTLGETGVDCSHIMNSEAPTGTAVITVVNGDNFIIIDHGANFSITLEDLTSTAGCGLLEWADIVLMQLEIPMETVRAAAALAKENGALVVLNPAPMDTALGADILQNVDLLIPNEHEAALLLGYELCDSTSEEAAAKELFSRFGCDVIVTLGERGSFYCGKAGSHRQAAFRVKVVDTTAAGDSFIGGLCTAVAGGMPMVEAMRFASAVSACAVSKPGAISSIPNRNEVEKLLSESEAAC